MAIDGVGWDCSYMANEEDHALVADGEAPTEFALMSNTESKEVKLEKDRLDGKLAGLLKAFKNLNHLIKSQRSDQVKEGVGYNVVPPAAADLYLFPKKDLSWTGLPEFVDDIVTDYSRPSPTIVSTSAEGQNKDSSTSEDVASPNPPKPFKVKKNSTTAENGESTDSILSKPAVKFVKAAERPTTDKVETSKKPALGPGFALHKKPCFNCGDISHLVNDFRKRVQRETTRKLPTGNSNVSTVCCCCSRHVNTDRPKAVINRRNRVKDVQASAYWVWKSIKPN
nr:hypothetical protein [Tanacetum cinerariifolium]